MIVTWPSYAWKILRIEEGIRMAESDEHSAKASGATDRSLEFGSKMTVDSEVH
jgi:hypothetical protein